MKMNPGFIIVKRTVCIYFLTHLFIYLFKGLVHFLREVVKLAGLHDISQLQLLCILSAYLG